MNIKRKGDAVLGFFMGIAATILVYAIYVVVKMIEGLTYKPPANL